MNFGALASLRALAPRGSRALGSMERGFVKVPLIHCDALMAGSVDGHFP